MPGIEEVDSSVLLGEDENLSRKGSTSQGKQSVGRLAEASGSPIGNRLGREKDPQLLFDTTNALTINLPFAPDFCREQMYNHTHEVQFFPIPILNLQRPTASTTMKTPVETEILRDNQSVSFEKDPG
jgi:hypothetical protein